MQVKVLLCLVDHLETVKIHVATFECNVAHILVADLQNVKLVEIKICYQCLREHDQPGIGVTVR